MDGERLTRFATVLIDYALNVQAGDTVLISGPPLARPLLTATYRRALERGAYPSLFVELPETLELLLTLGSDEQLQTITPLERIGPELADAWLRIGAAENTRALSHLDPARQQRYAQARAALHQQFLDRAAAGTLRWTSTLFPTHAYAQEASMSLPVYEDFFARAALLDTPDPAERWRAVSAYQERLIAWLTPHREIRVLGPDTDLRLRVDGRRWINSDGHRNFPSGEVFTGPIETSVEGTIRFAYATIIRGQLVADVRLRFEHGRVVSAEARQNQAALDAMLATDEGARYVGEFAFGTNRAIDRFTGIILLDEKMGGTIHLALGSGYPDTGSQNRSAIHWDLICDLRHGGEVWVDDILLLKNGQFQLPDLGEDPWTLPPDAPAAP